MTFRAVKWIATPISILPSRWISAAIGLLICAPLYANQIAPSSTSSGVEIDAKLEAQRATYQKALKALKRGKRTEFRRHLNKLQDYPLLPYLEYAELAIQLRSLPRKKVDAFLKDHAGTRVADKLRLRWLKELKRRRRGADFIQYYRPQLADTKLSCYYQYARYRTGDEKQKQNALRAGLELWNVGKSQPDDCDRLFKLLTKYDMIDSEVAWQRFTKALSNRKYSLARYISRSITEQPYKGWAEKARATSKNPALIGRYDNFASQTPEMLKVIEHNLKRLVGKQPVKTMSHWARYQQTHKFPVKTRSQITERIIKSLYNNDHDSAADEYLESSLELVPATLLEWRIRRALRSEQWQVALDWIHKLPGEYRRDGRWVYWHARLSHMLLDEDPAESYATLAQKRSFYGFLATEHLGGEYAMEHQPVPLQESQIATLSKLPGVLRARELHHHGETLSARREWHYAGRNFNEQDWVTAAELCRRWGWFNQSITSMIQASYWNDIEMRFPLHYQQAMEQYTEKMAMDTHLMLALARQESALAEDAVSPAGARGLMQIMPATAKQTARKHKIKYSNSDQLLNPAKNIELGTRYYRDILTRFDDNRILATAAYNAGPHRVSTWLKRSKGNLPYDAWIETIPFKETRHYVQNVLAFSAIYAHLLGEPSRILSEREKNMRL